MKNLGVHISHNSIASFCIEIVNVITAVKSPLYIKKIPLSKKIKSLSASIILCMSHRYINTKTGEAD